MLNNPRDIFAAYIAIGVAVPSCLLVWGWKSNDPTVIKLSATVATIITIFFIGIQSYFMRASVDEMKNGLLFEEIRNAIGIIQILERILTNNLKISEQGEYQGFKRIPSVDKLAMSIISTNNNPSISELGSSYLTSSIIREELKKQGIYFDKYNKKITWLSECNQNLMFYLKHQNCAQKFQDIFKEWSKENNGLGVPPLESLVESYVYKGLKGWDRYNIPNNIKEFLNVKFDECINANEEIKKIFHNRDQLIKSIKTDTKNLLDKLVIVKVSLGKKLL